MDRRIKRTKGAIFNAVLELMIEKDTNKITVLELCKKADINKSTFYLHYRSIDDCFESCFQIIMDGVVEISKHIIYNEVRQSPEKAINILLDEVEKKIDYLCKFKTSSICAQALKLLKENLVSSISKSNGFDYNNNYCEVSAITFAVGGCVDAIIEPLPIFKKSELALVMCNMIKSAKSQ